MILSIGGIQMVAKVPKIRHFPHFGGFGAFFHHLYSPDTEYHKQIYTEYALYQWNPLPHNSLGLKSAFQVWKSIFCFHIFTLGGGNFTPNVK